MKKQANNSLCGKRVLLIFQANIEFSARVRREIDILQTAGATIDLVSTVSNAQVNLNGHVHQVRSFEPQDEILVQIPCSEHPHRALRILSNITRNAARKILRLPMTSRKKSALFYFLLQHLEAYDVLWVYDVYGLYSAVQAHKKVSGIKPKIVYEVQDLVSEYGFCKSLSRKRKKWESQAILQVDKIITAGELYRDYYIEHYPETTAVCDVLIWPNFAHALPEKDPKSNCPRRLIFYGNLAHNRPIEEILQGLSIVKGEYLFDFVGDNRISEIFYDTVDSLKLASKVRYLGQVDPSAGVELVSHYDFGVVALAGDDENERRAPASKVGTYFAAGVAIIASSTPGIENLTRQSGSTVYAEGNTPKDWAVAIERAISIPDDKLASMKGRSSIAGIELEQSANKEDYIGVFSEAANSPNLKHARQG